MLRRKKLSRVEPRTLKENVTEILRQSIIDGSLAPGTEFNQAQLAEKLGVSRGPIREAVGVLEQEGLIQSTPYKGIVVTSLTVRSIEELYDVRVALETTAVQRGIQRMGSEDVDHLQHNVEQMRLAARQEDLEQLTSLDLEFHEYIVRMAGNQLLHKLWKQLEVSVRRCLHTRHTIYDSLDEIIGTHPLIIQAIAARDEALAVQTLHEHIAEAGEQVAENWRRHDADAAE